MISKSTLRSAARIVPGSETVTYTPMQPERDPFTVYRARFRPTADPAEFASQGIVITSGMALCIVPSTDLETEDVVPKMSDKITAADTSDWAGDWIVSGVNGGPLLSEYRLAVTKAR